MSRGCTMLAATRPIRRTGSWPCCRRCSTSPKHGGCGRMDGSNPCRHIERNPERGRERLLTPAELARLGDALAGYAGSLYVPGWLSLRAGRDQVAVVHGGAAIGNPPPALGGKRPVPSDLIHPSWNLNFYAKVAHQLNLISANTESELDPARDYRNLIHPAKVVREKVQFDRGTAFVGAVGQSNMSPGT